MAALVTYGNGLRRIEFRYTPKGPRRAVRLGRVSAKVAGAWKAKLEAIIADKALGRPHDPEVTAWLNKLPERMLKRLRAVGLADGVGLTRATLGTFLSQYIEGRADVKPATLITYRNAQRHLLGQFGANRSLDSITEADAQDFRVALAASGLAENTVRRRCAIARQLFRRAVKARLITSNPFGELKGLAVRENKSRMHFVSKADAEKILAACPDYEWKLIFALVRYGGLRCPSEVLALRWQDVDWSAGRFTVRSVKTERYDGHDTRVVPIFPELLPHLLYAHTEAEPGQVHVITRYRDATQNLRTTFAKIIRRAGLEPWPKLFVNLRSTRETELAEKWPTQVVAAWIGHSPTIALKHYLQVRDDDFVRAAGQAQQKAQQSAAESGPQPLNTPTSENAEVPENTGSVNDEQLSSITDKHIDWALQDSNL